MTKEKGSDYSVSSIMIKNVLMKDGYIRGGIGFLVSWDGQCISMTIWLVDWLIWFAERARVGY